MHFYNQLTCLTQQYTECAYFFRLFLTLADHTVAQLGEALHFKLDGCGCYWKFSLTYSFRPHSGHGFRLRLFTEMSTRNISQGCRADKLTTFMCCLS